MCPHNKTTRWEVSLSFFTEVTSIRTLQSQGLSPPQTDLSKHGPLVCISKNSGGQGRCYFLGHVLSPEPITTAGGMQCSDWLSPEQVSSRLLRKQEDKEWGSHRK